MPAISDSDSIRTGLESFAADMSKVPGRFNLLEINGATVIVDYGHNTSALEVLIEAVELFPNHRRIAVYSCVQAGQSSKWRVSARISDPLTRPSR